MALVLAALAVAVATVVACTSGVHLGNLVGWNEAERLTRALAIEPGMTVADVGAGKGGLAVAIARRVAPGGRVFATEIDPKRLAAIRDAIAREGLDNVTVVTAGERETGLPAACCEVVYLRNVYHHIAHPDALNASLFESVAPGGRLAVIDFEPGGLLDWLGGGARRQGHGVRPAQVIRELTAAGFGLERRNDRWGRSGYLLTFRRPPP